MTDTPKKQSRTKSSATSPAGPDSEALDLNPDGGLETLVDLRVPTSGRDSSVTNLPPVVQDPNSARLERMLAKQHRVYGVPTPLVGRRDQLEKVYDAVRGSVNTGTWRTIVVRGEPGMGKTRLVAEMFNIIDPVNRGIRVFATSASDSEAPDGLGVIAQLLRHRFDIRPTDSDDEAYDKVIEAVEAIVDERLVTTAARLLAYLAGLKAAVVRTGEARLDNVVRFHRRSLATLFNLIRFDASEAPQVLVVHRAQHLTPRAVEVFQQAAEELAEFPMTVIYVTTGRLPRTLAPKSDTCVDITIGRVPDDALTRLAQALLGDSKGVHEKLTADLVARSAGNPGLLEDNFRLLIERGVLSAGPAGTWVAQAKAPSKKRAKALPQTAEDVSAARIAALDEGLKRTLQMAAVIGPTFWSGVIVAMSRTESRDAAIGKRDVPWVEDRRGEAVAALLEGAIEADLVVESKTSAVPDTREYRFVNRSANEVLYEAVEPETRARWHRMAAQWFETVEAADGHPGRWAEPIASHLEAGQRAERAAPYLLSAARTAARSYDLNKARDLYRRGVASIDLDRASLLVELLEGLGDVEFQRGDLSDAGRTFGTLLEATLLAGDKDAGARSWLRLGQVHRARADYSRARPCFQNALRLYRSMDHTQGIADSLDEIAKLVWLQGSEGSYDEALDFFRRALDIRRVLGEPVAIALSLSNTANIRLLRGEFKPALQSFEEALTLRKRAGDRAAEAMSYVGIGGAYFASGDYEAAVDRWQTGVALAESVGHRGLAGVFLNNLGEVRLRQGRLDEAETLLSEALEVAEDTGDQRAIADIGRNLAAVEADRGEWKPAMKRAKKATDLAREIASKTTLGAVLVTFGDILSRYAEVAKKGPDRRAKADKAFEQAQRLFAGAGDVVGTMRVLEAMAQHAARFGDSERAAELEKEGASIREACEAAPALPTAPLTATAKPRGRKKARSKQTTVPGMAPFVPGDAARSAKRASVPPMPPLPPLPIERGDDIPSAPNHTIEFDASELQQGLIEVPAALSKVRALKAGSKPTTKSGPPSGARKKTTKRKRPQPETAPPPLPDTD